MKFIRALIGLFLCSILLRHVVAAPQAPVVQAPDRELDLSVALSPDGRFLAGCGDISIYLYETRTGQLRRALRGGGRPVWSPDGKIPAVGGNGVRLWQMPAATLLRFEKRGGGGLAFDRTGRHFACGVNFKDDKGAVFETHSGRMISKSDTTPGDHYHAGWQSSLGKKAFLSPDARRILTFNAQDYDSGTKSVRARLRDVATGRLLREFTSELPLISAAWSPDGHWIAFGEESNVLTLWNPKDGSTKKLLKGPSGGQTERVWSVLFSANGKTLVSSSDDDTLRFWKIPSGELERALPLPPGTDSYFLSASADLSLLTLRSYRDGVTLLNADGQSGAALPPSPPISRWMRWCF